MRPTHSYFGELVKNLTIDLPSEVRDARKVIYLTNTVPEDPEDPTTTIPVHVYLTNNGHPVPGPKYYKVPPNDVRYLVIINGRIVSIEN